MKRSPDIALANFKGALEGEVARLRAMDEVAFLERCIELCEEHDRGGGATIGRLLPLAVNAGSIEAAAAMMVLGISERKVAAALADLAARYSDVKEGLVIAGLTEVVGGWLDEEVAAGRMTVTRGPNGEKLYSSVGGKSR